MLMTPNQRGSRLSPEEIDEIVRHLTTHLTAQAPFEVIRHGTGLHLRLNYTDAFPVQITGGSQPYSWQEVYPQADGSFAVPPVARTGTLSIQPAYEMNGSTSVPTGVYVLLTDGAYTYNPTGQEYIFSWPAGMAGGMGTLSVPLAVTSLNPVNGLYPAIRLNYSAATNTFSDSTEFIWAITTNQNALDLVNYTGILIGHGGSPAADIYCINDNLVVEKSDGSFKFAGKNQILLDPPYTWNVGAGAFPGQVKMERILTVQDERGNPPVEHTWLETFRPYYTWDIGQTPVPGEVTIRRLFEVQLDGNPVQDDVFIENFLPACTWQVQASGLGAVNIRRIFNVQAAGGVAISDVANLVFTPNCAWNVVAGSGCTAVVERLFTVQTDNVASGQFFDVAGLRFIPDCAWTLAADGGVACGVTVSRKFAVTDDNATEVDNVANLQFYPYYTWQVGAGGSCEARVQRLLFVNGVTSFGPDIYIIQFNTLDFIVAAGGRGAVTVRTLGLTGTFEVCMGDGFVHLWTFQDGLLQQIV